jgi:hypothetical protein
MVRMRIAAAVIGCIVVGLAWAGCSSTDNQPKGAGGSAGAGGHAGAPPSDSGSRDRNLNCVKPGTPNNEKGVGGYCESSAECASDVGGFFICSGDFDTTPQYAWFCTTFCTVDADCGSNAYCGHSDLGGGCVPYGCGTGPEGGYPDTGAGADTGADVVADRGPDAAPEGGPDVAVEGSLDVALDVAADVPADAPPEATVDGATD